MAATPRTPPGAYRPPHPLRAAVALVSAVGAVACATPDRRTEQEVAADKALVDQVHDALRADTNLYAAHINVDAKRGVVWLSGFVDSADQDRAASVDSQAVPGVQRVVDQLEVMDWMPHW